MNSNWHDIPGYEGIYKVNLETAQIKNKNGKILSTYMSAGRLKVVLYKGGKRRVFSIGQIICLTVYGPCPPGMVTCHNDGSQHNNHSSNLRYDTQRNNMRDQVSHDKTARKEVYVIDVYRRLVIKYSSQRKASQELCISESHISRLVKNNRKKGDMIFGAYKGESVDHLLLRHNLYNNA